MMRQMMGSMPGMGGVRRQSKTRGKAKKKGKGGGRPAPGPLARARPEQAQVVRPARAGDPRLSRQGPARTAMARVLALAGPVRPRCPDSVRCRGSAETAASSCRASRADSGHNSLICRPDFAAGPARRAASPREGPA